MSTESTVHPVYAVDTNAMPWGEMPIEELNTTLPIKGLMSDPDTGMTVSLIRYKAGFTNVWHRHNCAHGMYILDGVLQTHAGNIGPGSFVWFPEGLEMQHGATLNQDVTMLFITNKPYDIHYSFKDQDKA